MGLGITHSPDPAPLASVAIVFVVQNSIFNKDGTPVPKNASDEESDGRRFPPGSPPVASTCSAAISAACHPVTISEERIHGKLRWAVDGSVLNGVDHCYIVSDENWRQGYAEAPGES
ncbi:uncharacterized protein RSE6_10486 [Rhynchosporium secalis]|uniref:Uncharacterized protein n=1 Tax=Rhynchosporium secalis TaxID=38038 RepID=A0A1E1MKI4_RHYSE|nr:uncharacterized protein RSE6_10486 [Rhynchosporium secalis]